MPEYAIRYRDRNGQASLLADRYPSLDTCHAQIRRYANAWERQATSIQHHPGLSFAYFPDGTYIEAWRAGQSELGEREHVEVSR